MRFTSTFPVLAVTRTIGVLFVGVTAASFLSGLVVNLVGFDPDWFIAWYKLVHVNGEDNVPTWLSAVVMAFSGQMLLLIGYEQWRRQGAFIWHWVGLGVLFFGLSMDEFLQFHEQLIAPLHAVFDIDRDILYFAWVVPGSVFVAVIGGIYLPFLRYLSPLVRYKFVAAGIVFLSGALLLEAISGIFFGQDVFFLLVHAEEFLEMMGITLFFHAVLTYLTSLDELPGPQPTESATRTGAMLTE